MTSIKAEAKKNKYTYTIFDIDPGIRHIEVLDYKWPTHSGVKIFAKDFTEASVIAEEAAIDHAISSGKYKDGDTVWIVIWDKYGGEGATYEIQLELTENN